MVTIRPVEQASMSSIQIQSVAGLVQAIPSLAVGDIIPVVLRQTLGNGKGLINIGGKLMEAGIPKDLAVGEKVFAQIVDASKQVTLKILDGYQAGNRAPAGREQLLLLELTQKLEAVANQTLVLRNTGDTSITLPSLKSGQADPLQRLLAALGTVEDFFSSDNIQAQLRASTDGNLSTTLRNLATGLQELTNHVLSKDSQSFFAALREALIGATTQQAGQARTQALTSIQEMILKHLQSNVLSDDDKQLLAMVLKEIQAGRNNSAHTDTAIAKSLDLLKEHSTKREKSQPLGNPDTIAVYAQLETLLEQAKDGSPADKSLSLQFLQALKDSAVKLERMATSLDTLNQFNPVMQALGEPAMILFPFLFQGFMGQGELVLESQKGQKQRKKNQEEDITDEDGKKNSELYNKFQINLPLPNMGTIDIEVAHRSSEIMIKFTTENEQVAQFIDSHLPELDTLLHSQGFALTSLQSTKGKIKIDPPPWCITLSKTSDFIA